MSTSSSSTHPPIEEDRVQQSPPDHHHVDSAGLHILDMVSNLSHELLSPLASITGYAETLLRVEDRLASAERQDFLRAIIESSARLETLLGRLLELAYLQGAALSLHITTVDLWLLARQALTTAEQLAAQTGRPFTFRLVTSHPVGVVNEQSEPEEAPFLDERKPFLTLGDPQQLLTLLTHVLENAVKYSAEGGEIEVSLDTTPSRSHSTSDSTPDGVIGSANESPTDHDNSETPPESAAFLIRVRDQGIGVPEDQLEAIFTPFRRVDASLTSVTAGMGIGLALCRHIAVAHGGAIWAEREPHKGSVFTIRLPRLDTQAVAQ